MSQVALTPKQRKFAEEYVQSGNAEQSALAAGYSKHYAHTKQKVLLSHDGIVAEIQRLRNKLNQRAEKNATDVVNEYAKIAFTDRVDFLKEDPHFPGTFIYKSPDELTTEQRSVIEKVNLYSREIRVVNAETGEVTELNRQEYSYVLSDKANALQQMGRHFGIFDDKLKLTTTHQNPFKNATPEQLAQLKASFVGIMTGATIDGEYTEVQNVLPNGKGRNGSGR